MIILRTAITASAAAATLILLAIFGAVWSGHPLDPYWCWVTVALASFTGAFFAIWVQTFSYWVTSRRSR